MLPAMGPSWTRVAAVALVALLAGSLVACGTAPAGPSGTSMPAGSGATGAPATGSPASGSPSDGADGVAAATPASAEQATAAELEVADAVAAAAGLPLGLGAEHWSWARQLLLDEAAKAAQDLVVAGDAGLTASLQGGPPRLPVLTAGAGGAGVMGLAMAGSMINTALQSASSPSGSNSGSVSGTQSTTADGETTTGTVSFSLATSTSGSTIEGDVSIGVDVTVTDAASGALLRTGHFKSQGRIKLDFCPDANGKVHGHVSMTIEGGVSGGGAAGIVVEADVVGTVGDDAYLNEVEITGQSTQSTTTAASRSPRTVTTSMGYRASVGRNGLPTYQQNSATGQGTGPGDLTDAEVDQGYRQITTAAAMAIWVMGDAAQAKWRNGACVEIRSTERSRDVQKNELVQFESKVWHRIEGVELNKNIVNSFAGTQSLDPVDIPVPAPVTNSFKAGPESDDTGTVTMTSTSNRGIGELTLTFRVKGGWFIEEPNRGGILVGLKCGDPDGEWVVNGTYSINGFEGNQTWKMTINPDEATGTFTYTDHQVSNQFGVQIELEGQAEGTVDLTIDPVTGDARMELRETFHSFRSRTPGGGYGGDQNAPLQSYRFNWDVGGDC
jgi:hypothetical protein